MGNSSNSISGLVKEYEYQSGEKLIRAIKADSRQQLDACMDFIKQEFISQSRKMAHDKEFEMLQQIIKNYLTRGYDIGDGVLFTKSPLEIAELNHAQVAKAFIIEKLENIKRFETLSTTSSNATSNRSTGGAIDKSRVAEAKERLKKFQEERKKS